MTSIGILQFPYKGKVIRDAMGRQCAMDGLWLKMGVPVFLLRARKVRFDMQKESSLFAVIGVLLSP